MWVQLDHDFGLSYVTLVVGLRKMVNDGLRLEACTTPQQVETLAKELEAYVVMHRPKLAGCKVVSISNRFGLKADITVIHPSLPKVVMGDEVPREHLELCAACGKALEVSGVYQLVILRSYGTSRAKEVMVCNEACAQKLSEPML